MQPTYTNVLKKISILYTYYTNCITIKNTNEFLSMLVGQLLLKDKYFLGKKKTITFTYTRKVTEKKQTKFKFKYMFF